MGSSSEEENNPSLNESTDRDDQISSDHGLVASQVDPETWRMEVARVAPKLKIKILDEGNDWRDDLTQVYIGHGTPFGDPFGDVGTFLL